MNRTDRLLGLLLALQGSRRTSTELAARFEVSRRTILRDIDGLCQAGVPIVAISGPSGGYELPAGYHLQPLQLTSGEAALLLLALAAFGRDGATPFGPARVSVEEKLRAALPAPILAAAEQDASSIAVTSTPASSRLQHLPVLRDAATRGHWLRIDYLGASGPVRRTIFPTRLTLDRGRWYCRAVSADARADRTFRADRVLAVERTPPPVDADALLAVVERARCTLSHAVRVEVRCDRSIVRQIDDHPDFAGSVAADGDGSLLAFDAPRSELDYFARELFALGPAAIVLRPPELVARVRDRASRTLARYSSGDGDGTLSPISAHDVPDDSNLDVIEKGNNR